MHIIKSKKNPTKVTNQIERVISNKPIEEES